MKIDEYPNVREIIESFSALSYSIDALEGLTAKSLSAELFGIISKIKTCRTKTRCCFLKITTARNIYKNREGLIFDLFMSHTDLPLDWKRQVCRDILDGSISTNNIIEIYSNFHEAGYKGISLSKKELRDKALLRCEKNFLFMTVNDNRFDGALKIYYSVSTKNLMPSLPRYAVRWHGILENKVPETIRGYGINSRSATDLQCSSFQHKLGALDLLSEQHNGLSAQQAEDILNNAMKSSHRKVRKRAYQVGAEIVGWSYYEKGLEDPSLSVRQWIQRVLEEGKEYSFTRGRLRKGRDVNQMKLF